MLRPAGDRRMSDRRRSAGCRAPPCRWRTRSAGPRSHGARSRAPINAMNTPWPPPPRYAAKSDGGHVRWPIQFAADHRCRALRHHDLDAVTILRDHLVGRAPPRDRPRDLVINLVGSTATCDAPSSRSSASVRATICRCRHPAPDAACASSGVTAHRAFPLVTGLRRMQVHPDKVCGH